MVADERFYSSGNDINLETCAELSGVLTSIGIVAKKLAKKLMVIEQRLSNIEDADD